MTFINKTIRSNYLDRNFEVSCWEMEQKNGRKLIIIEHAALEDIIFNEIAQPGFNYELTPVVGMANHPVAMCVMTDANRRIIAIGEAHPESLVNKISRQNPVIMACNRAFDRAAIRYLDLEGKIYSSEEIPEEDENENAAGVASEDELNIENVLFGGDETPDPTIEPPSDVSDKAENPGEVIINFGKYRDKHLTVAQICATDQSWVDYTINMNTDRCGETTIKQINALKAYKAASEV